MPKTWLYILALFIPLIFRILVLHTAFVDWLWYNHHQQAYYALSALRVHPQFLEFIGGWALPVFIVTVFLYWSIEENDPDVPRQFLLLPIIYVPFTIAADLLVHFEFHASNLYVHPLVIIPVGYVYIFLWVMFITVLEKLRLVL